MLSPSPSIDRSPGATLQDARQDRRAAVAPHSRSGFGAATMVSVSRPSSARVQIGQVSVERVDAGRLVGAIRAVIELLIGFFFPGTNRPRPTRNRLPAKRVLSSHVNLYA